MGRFVGSFVGSEMPRRLPSPSRAVPTAASWPTASATLSDSVSPCVMGAWFAFSPVATLFAQNYEYVRQNALCPRMFHINTLSTPGSRTLAVARVKGTPDASVSASRRSLYSSYSCTVCQPG